MKTYKTTISLFLFCALTTVFLFFAGGCSKAKESAKIILNIEGQEFSDAQIYIDGKPVGRFTQTVIKQNGELFIDSVFQARIPPRENQSEEEAYSGTFDSLVLPSGSHTFAYLTPAGKRLEFTVNILPGYHLMTYFPEKETIKCGDESFKIAPGQSLAITLRSGKSK